MDKPIFESSALFRKIQVFNDRIVYIEGVLKKQHIIFAKEIASIDTGLGGVTIETSGGNKITIPVKHKDQSQFLRTIAQIRRS